ncbi:hypothetical protein C8J57DRAFT_1705278 [Mycena rebaudengoi]|nr:hypothetical protein C8J57DRAFT_1705278 [Mycena rebaudengoi]
MSEDHLTLGLLLQSSVEDLEEYKRYINFPPLLAANPYYSASNRVEWVKLDKYAIFLREGKATREKYASTRIPTVTETVSAEEANSTKRPAKEVIQISDSDSDSDSEPPPKKRAKHVTIKTEPLPLDSATCAVIIKHRPDGRISITKRESVERVVQLDRVPERWPIDSADTAYVITFPPSAKLPGRGETFKGPKGLDALVKSEDQDSYGKGTNGSTSQNIKLTILGGLPSRRSSHDCNGGLCCQYFDREVLDGFYRLTQRLKCKKTGCTGRAVLKTLNDGPSDEGKFKFIGCSKWRAHEQYDHIYASIQSSVDEEILAQYMNGTSIPSEDIEDYDDHSCSHFIHPRHGKQKQCPHTHFRDGQLVVRSMIRYACPVKKIVYTSMDSSVRMCVVIFRGLHSHPSWPMEKPGQAAKDDVTKCLESMGTFGTTGGKLDNSATTRALLGTDLSVKHPAFRGKRKLRDAVLNGRDAATPTGLLWAGILDQYEHDLGLPSAQQYIRAVRMEGGLKLAVCLDTDLAALLHEARYMVPDFTFKRVVGDINEWEVAIWLDGEKERVSAARIYCNRATKQAFTYIFEDFFVAIENVTGQPLRFKAFDPKGNILSIHFDMEAAGQHPEQDPDVIVRYVIKFCSVHFTRSTDPLESAVGHETVKYLNRIRGLTAPEDIEEWHNFCRTHENKKLRDWYAHKIQYSWLLPGLNESLSLFPAGVWMQTPSHTNLVESAHAGTNQNTGTRLLPLEAIQRARAVDAAKAASLAATRTSCILVNRHNNDGARMLRTVTRGARRTMHRNEHMELENGIADTRKQLQEATKTKTSLAQRLKELKTEKKGLGRAPRNNQSVGRSGTALNIPRVSSSTLASGDDSDVEFVDGDAFPSTSSLSLRPSSAASSNLEFTDAQIVDYESDAIMSGHSTAPPSSSSGFDLASHASDFEDFDDYNFDAGFDDGGDVDWGQIQGGGDAHAGHQLIGAPGFDLDEFLAACGASAEP